jgi:pimeloyl-ACP methyl ester carboxylesterase
MRRIKILKKKHTLLKIAGTLGTVTGMVEGINRLIFHLSVKDTEIPDESHMVSWKNGDFYYEKIENQEREESEHAPILILHDLYPTESSESCRDLAESLSKERTVYLIDLLGCGKSEKAAITYTNYLYVLQVTKMIKEIIGEPVHLVACGRSGSIAAAVVHSQIELVKQLTFVDPAWEEEEKVPDSGSRMTKKLIELPIVGTLLYNMAFKMNPNAHLGGTNARYLYASMSGNYTNWNTSWMVKDLDIPVHTVWTKEIPDIEEENDTEE